MIMKAFTTSIISDVQINLSNFLVFNLTIDLYNELFLVIMGLFALML